ncbi:MAG: SAM-dependent methyltransferase [Bacteroidetes bacterium]|nr:SAM-dependent methyltransferase [Bacteroidota bacterium]
MKTGKLYLIPTPIGNNPVFPPLFFPLELLNTIDVFIVEELTTARRFLKSTGYSTHFDNVTFLVLNEQSKPEETGLFLPYILAGKNVGLMSEAGLPCIADPGAEAVRLAHSSGVEVVPLPGASSVFLALMASGANGQKFCFHGYLPIDKTARIRKIREIEKIARMNGESQIFMETPYRNEKLLESILASCKEDTHVSVSCDLLSDNQLIISDSVRNWKKLSKPDLHKRPAIFILFY